MSTGTKNAAPNPWRAIRHAAKRRTPDGDAQAPDTLALRARGGGDDEEMNDLPYVPGVWPPRKAGIDAVVDEAQGFPTEPVATGSGHTNPKSTPRRIRRSASG